jgi:hypothetical protein
MRISVRDIFRIEWNDNVSTFYRDLLHRFLAMAWRSLYVWNILTIEGTADFLFFAFRINDEIIDRSNQG